MDRSLRHLGQLLVVMGALLGAALRIALALVVGNATTSGAMLASGPARAGEAAGQADHSGGKAGKSKELRHDDPGKSKDKAKSKDKSK